MMSQHSSTSPITSADLVCPLLVSSFFYWLMNNTVKSFWLVLVSQKVVTALDKTWHPEHFFCAQCGSFFGPDGTVAKRNVTERS